MKFFFLTFFAETETIWSQGPATRDFFKSYSIRLRYSTFKHFRACSACDEIGSTYAQHAMKFVPRMRVCWAWIVHVKTVHILPQAEHARKFVPRMLSVRQNRFCVCSAYDKIVSAIIFENTQKYQIKMQILTKNNRNFQKPKVKILKKKNFWIAHQKNLVPRMCSVTAEMF